MQVSFLPGYLCDERLFSSVMDTLPTGFSPVYVPLPAEDSIEAIAESIIASGGVDGSVLVGLSMGGIVALEIIRQVPERIRGISLMDSNALADTPQATDARNRLVAEICREGYAGPLQRSVIPKMLHPNRHSDTALRELIVAMAKTCGTDALIRHAAALSGRRDNTEALKRFPGPVQILAGRDDQLCPLDRQVHMHAVQPQAIFTLIESCGHLSTLEAPAAASAGLNSWLATLLNHPGNT